MPESSRLKSLWNLLCSLKLAIVLASAATLITVIGSLSVPGNPQIFGTMDGMALSDWLTANGRTFWQQSWWVFAFCALLLLLGLNTLCCFIDWAWHLRRRWRKSGEYLIHLGFVLVVTAYFWGSLDGFRQEGVRLAVGQTLPIKEMPGHYLRLEAFEPELDRRGRPLEMLNKVSIRFGDNLVAEQTIRTNHPLIWQGLVVLPMSFDRSARGFRFLLPGRGLAELTAGSRLELPGGGWLKALAFHPHAWQSADGRIFFGSQQLGNPAFELEVNRPGQALWKGTWLLSRRLPEPLLQAGLQLRPLDPIYGYVSILTVNRDPGAVLALAGALAMTLGVALALVSFYRKRALGERPEI